MNERRPVWTIRRTDGAPTWEIALKNDTDTSGYAGVLGGFPSSGAAGAVAGSMVIQMFTTNTNKSTAEHMADALAKIVTTKAPS